MKFTLLIELTVITYLSVSSNVLGASKNLASFAQVTQDHHFSAVVFNNLPSKYRLMHSSIIWIKKVPTYPMVPSRIAVGYEYSSNLGKTYLIEVKSIHGVSAHKNLDSIRSQGYFGLQTLQGTRLRYMTQSGVDCLILCNDPSISSQSIKSLTLKKLN